MMIVKQKSRKENLPAFFLEFFIMDFGIVPFVFYFRCFRRITESNHPQRHDILRQRKILADRFNPFTVGINTNPAAADAEFFRGNQHIFRSGGAVLLAVVNERITVRVGAYEHTENGSAYWSRIW